MSEQILDPAPLEAIRAVQQPGSEDLVAKILEIFYEQSRSTLRELASAIGETNADAIAQKAHFLKSSSLNVGAVKVAALSQQIEAAARSCQLDEIELTFVRLQGELESALEALGKIAPPSKDQASTG